MKILKVLLLAAVLYFAFKAGGEYRLRQLETQWQVCLPR